MILRTRPLCVRLWKHYFGYRSVGIGRWHSIKYAFLLARLVRASRDDVRGAN